MKTFSKLPGVEEKNTISCPLCGSSDYALAWRNQQTFVRCRECACVYQNPQPVLADLLKRYDAEYLDYELENESTFFELMKLGLCDIDFDTIAEEFDKDRSFLDIGCATGMLLEFMGRQGWVTNGVEVCEPAARYGIENRNVSIHIGTLESAVCSDESFTVVHCSHLIEHLVDPWNFLKEVYRLLVPGGYFIVTTPNISGLQARLFGFNWRSAIEDHMVLFSKKNLCKALAKAGFSVKRIKTWGGLAAGAGPLWLKKPLDKVVKKTGSGDVMIIAARKPHNNTGG